MTDNSEFKNPRMVCEIVHNPDDVHKTSLLFELAGKMLGQEVELKITNDPGIAAAAVLAESLASYSSDIRTSLRDIREGLKKDNPKKRDSGLEQLGSAIVNDPYAKAGLALESTILGSVAIFVNVDEPRAFRRELEIFKNLSE